MEKEVVALISCPFLRLLFRNSPLLLPMHSMAAEEVAEKKRNGVDLLRHGAMVVAAATVVDADQPWQSLVSPGVGPWDVLLDGVDPTRYYSLHHRHPSSC